MKKLLVLLMCLCMLLSGCTTSTGSTEVAKVEAEKATILNNTDTNSEASESENSATAGSHTFDSVANNTDDDDILVIGETLFTEQINYIYFNPDEYIGKQIQYEGLYALYQDVEGNYMDVIYRYGPGCCTTDEEVGFEVIYDGDVELKENDWVEVTGTVEYVTHGGVKYLAVVLSDLTVKEERGQETVA